jgi:hypothetical protein
MKITFPILLFALAALPCQRAEAQAMQQDQSTAALVGTWEGKFVFADDTYGVSDYLSMKVRTTLKKDGTYVHVLQGKGVVVASKGTWKFSDGVVTSVCKEVGGLPTIGLAEQATVEWLNKDTFIYTGGGVRITYYRK